MADETQAAPPSRWQDLYQRPLVDLGERFGEKLRGIYSPGYDEALVRQYVQKQFLEDASTYAGKYQNTDHFHWLITNALAKTALKSGTPDLRILDIGSGAGNSIVPLMQLFPDSLVIASDFSIELLALLQRATGGASAERRCALLQLNAEELEFRDNTFDLVVGAAILHHLFSPEKAVEGCSRILKPGGIAMFFEPFENGNMLLRMVYQQILDRPLRRLPEEVGRILGALIRDFDLRRGRDKSAPIFRTVDDKWLFTLSYFRELADRYGFSSCRVHPLYETTQQFRKQTEAYLRLAGGLAPAAMPTWAWDLVDSYDQRFSEECKADFLIEGCVILQK